jgi:anti-anti-sigma factor
MHTTVTREETITILALAGRLDAATAPALEKELAKMAEPGVSHLVLELSELDYIASAGLRLFLRTAQAYKGSPFRFAACAMQDHILEVFEISGFDSIITIHGSLAESRTALTETPSPPPG